MQVQSCFIHLVIKVKIEFKMYYKFKYIQI
jgi:hypothetical protein